MLASNWGRASRWHKSLRSLVVIAFGAMFMVCMLPAQSAPPPSMTFHCIPDPLYVNTSSTCTAHVGGGATGSVTLSVGGTPLGSFGLDSSGNAYGTTGAFAPNPGVAVLTATYSGDANYTSATRDEGLTVYADKVIVTAETLTCSPYVVTAGQPISCTVHIPGGATGSVSFQIGTSAWANAAVDANGNATVTNGLAGAAVGPYTIYAQYSGDSNFGAFQTSTSESVYSIKPQPSSMNVGCMPATIVSGQSGSCTLHLTGGPTGTVDLYVHDQYWTTVTLDVNGNATTGQGFTSLAAGTYGVTAMYNGDANFDTASAATTISITGTTNTPTSSVSCMPNALSPGQGTNCTAQLPAGATGNVLFYVGGTYWTTVPLSADGTATATNGLYTLPAGSYAVTSYYSGDQNFSPGGSSTGATVPITANKTAPAVSLACSPSALRSGSVTTCTANVGGGATGAVLFLINGSINAGLGLDATGQVIFQNQFQGAPNATFNIQAAYQGDQNFSGAAGSSTVTVASAQTTPTITASMSPSTVASGGQLSVGVHVDGGATGNVDISVNGGYIIRLGLDANGNAVGAEHLTGAANGSYSVNFFYGGDNNFNQASTTLPLTVGSGSTQQPPPTTTPPPPPSTSAPPAAGAVLYSYSVTQPDGTTSGFDPVGNIVSFTDSVNGTWSAGYDALNRLIAATQTQINGQPALVFNSPSQSFCWLYDSFGNRMQQGVSDQSFGAGCQANSQNTTQTIANYDQNAANNRITSVSGGPTNNAYVYDQAGNVTDDGSFQYLYDGNGKLCASLKYVVGVMTGYLYDAEGQRVAKGSLTSFSCDMSSNGFTVTNEYIPGPNGEALTELDGNGNVLHTNAYAGGELIATYDARGAHFNLNDWLGTRRVQTDYTGNSERTCSGGSFGDLLNCTGTYDATAATEIHFTGKERDSESGLDYFGARYYGSSMGRFMSPDDGSGQGPSDPQSWNLYPYARNNPIANTDPTGNDCVTQTRLSDSTESVSTNTGNCSGNVGDGQKQTYVSGTITGVSAGADGHSIDIGSTNADGSSTVTNAGSAPTADFPGLAYNYGNNAQGYQMLGAASRAVNTGTAIYAGIFAAGACAVYCPAAAATAAFNARNLYYTATGLLPVAYTAVQKLANLNISVAQANEIIESPTTQRLVDNANGGNINYVAEVAGKLVRITTDPAGQRIISAGTMRANQIANGLKSGRFN